MFLVCLNSGFCVCLFAAQICSSFSSLNVPLSHLENWLPTQALLHTSQLLTFLEGSFAVCTFSKCSECPCSSDKHCQYMFWKTQADAAQIDSFCSLVELQPFQAGFRKEFQSSFLIISLTSLLKDCLVLVAYEKLTAWHVLV